MLRMKAVPLNVVRIEDSFWSKRIDQMIDEILPYQWDALNDAIPGAEPSHTIENFRIAAGKVQADYYGMVFQDSDVAKWLEAVGYALAIKRDEKLERIADDVIELLGRAQQPDGYLNTYFTVAKPGQRWTNLRDDHELYCAGHLIEAAVAYYEATGKRTFLDIMCRYADYIASVFGAAPEQIAGYDGHPEIELALVRLYHATGEKKYLELSKYFVEERGRTPHFFQLEDAGRTEKRAERKFDYFQAHLPVREQRTAEGHSVRALYLFSGVTDLAVEYNDSQLLEVSKELWRNVTQKRMYVTGAVGSNERWESFTIDYDLPNDRAYAETCASISLMFWAHRLLQIEADREYADVMEKVLYNGILSGISLDGKRYFYVNPLEVWPEACRVRDDLKSVKPERQPWFGCACCPPNIARLIASLGQYIYSANNEQKELYVHLFIGSETTVNLGDTKTVVKQQTNYPWDPSVSFAVTSDRADEWTLALRLPGWCREPRIRVNGQELDVSGVNRKGYAYIKRVWSSGDQVELTLPMNVDKVRANPKLRENIGKAALQRGPIVYCLEEADNGPNLPDLRLPHHSELIPVYENELLDGIVALEGEALRSETSAAPGDALYFTASLPTVPVRIRAVPYYAWANRGLGEMAVWIREGGAV